MGILTEHSYRPEARNVGKDERETRKFFFWCAQDVQGETMMKGTNQGRQSLMSGNMTGSLEGLRHKSKFKPVS